MARSMTGFGRGENISPEQRCTVEIKSVNSKYFDIQIRNPRILNGIENQIRKSISSKLQRGKIDVYIFYEDYRDDYKKISVDAALVKAYHSALSEIAEMIGSDQKINISNISGFNDVLKVETLQIDDGELWDFVSSAVGMAIENINLMRDREGANLILDISEKAKELKVLHKSITERSPLVVREFSARLTKRIEDLADDMAVKKIDEQRLAMEIAFFADKCSIDEELVRLSSHLEQLGSILEEDAAVGKKLDFLVQEINREINTIGSKANDITITGYVMEMKNKLENIREQIQNME